MTRSRSSLIHYSPSIVPFDVINLKSVRHGCKVDHKIMFQRICYIVYIRRVQLQAGCDLLFSVKTASNLPPRPLSSYLALSKNIGKNNMTHDKFVVRATCIESTDLPCSLVRRLGLHFIHRLFEVRWVLGESQFQGILLERCLLFVIFR
jgi:hypothetical protein